MITVLIVDDSAVARQSIAHILSHSTRLEIVGTVGSGEEALGFLAGLKKSGKPLPNVIIIDIVMPGMDGFETTRRVMETTPLPIIIASSGLDIDTAEKTFQALNAGAVAVVQKVLGVMHPEYQKKSAELRRLVESMASVPVIRRWNRPPAPIRKPPVLAPSVCVEPALARNLRLVAIGASTGGPAAIQAILEGLTPNFSLPILIVQHISSGFVDAMAEWMSRAANLPVSIPEQGEKPLPGHVYLAPDDFHMVISSDMRIRLINEPTTNSQKPSVSRLFESVAVNVGCGAVGILLTGMGQDGAAELKKMRNSGALTIAQDRESSVVYGMPGTAENMDAADYFMAPADIAILLNNLAKRG